MTSLVPAQEMRDAVAAFRKCLPTPRQARKKAAEEGGVVLGSDGKFHSGSSAEQKRMHDAFMFAFDKALDLTENPPSPADIAAGCPAGEATTLLARLEAARRYLAAVGEAVKGRAGNDRRARS